MKESVENNSNESKESIDEVDKIIEESYVELAELKGENPDSLHYSRWCEMITDIALKKFEAAGIKSREIVYTGGWDVSHHVFLEVEIDNEKWFIDPTWQQFLEKPYITKPKILQSRAADFGDALTALGIPQRLHLIWLVPIKRALEKSENL